MQLEGVDGEYIAVEYDEVAALARLQTAARLLLFQCIRGIDRVGIDDILQGNALFWQQRRAAARLAARHGMLHRLERVEAAHAPVTATGDKRACVAQRARRIEVARALGSKIGER